MLVKGRRNYLSRRRLDNALSRAASLFNDDEEFDELRRIDAWAKQTGDGSLSDLDFRPHPAVWDEVASDHGNCMGRACPRYKDCFYYQARRRMQPCPDSRGQPCPVLHRSGPARQKVNLLPKYDVVVFDEAHTLEAVAGDHLGLSITDGQVEFTLRRAVQRAEQPRPAGASRPGEAAEAGLGVPRPGRAVFRRCGRVAARPAGRQRPRAPSRRSSKTL